MTYDEFSRYLANYGFLFNPFTEAEYAQYAHLGTEVLYSTACDLNAGIPFDRAIKINSERK